MNIMIKSVDLVPDNVISRLQQLLTCHDSHEGLTQQSIKDFISGFCRGVEEMLGCPEDSSCFEISIVLLRDSKSVDLYLKREDEEDNAAACERLKKYIMDHAGKWVLEGESRNDI